MANGWSGQLRVGVDAIAKHLCRQQMLLISTDATFPTWNCSCIRGVQRRWPPGRRAYGSSSVHPAIPVTASLAFRDMGFAALAVASPAHPLTSLQGPLNDEQLRPYPSLCIGRHVAQPAKRDTWTLITSGE